MRQSHGRRARSAKRPADTPDYPTQTGRHTGFQGPRRSASRIAHPSPWSVHPIADGRQSDGPTGSPLASGRPPASGVPMAERTETDQVLGRQLGSGPCHPKVSPSAPDRRLRGDQGPSPPRAQGCLEVQPRREVAPRGGKRRAGDPVVGCTGPRSYLRGPGLWNQTLYGQAIPGREPRLCATPSCHSATSLLWSEQRDRWVQCLARCRLEARGEWCMRAYDTLAAAQPYQGFSSGSTRSPSTSLLNPLNRSTTAISSSIPSSSRPRFRTAEVCTSSQ